MELQNQDFTMHKKVRAKAQGITGPFHTTNVWRGALDSTPFLLLQALQVSFSVGQHFGER
jgi:hypothetical protein